MQDKIKQPRNEKGQAHGLWVYSGEFIKLHYEGHFIKDEQCGYWIELATDKVYYAR